MLRGSLMSADIVASVELIVGVSCKAVLELFEKEENCAGVAAVDCE